jgi:hypothetical protein
MKAIVHQGFGSLEILRCEEIDKPITDNNLFESVSAGKPDMSALWWVSIVNVSSPSFSVNHGFPNPLRH